MDALYNHTLAGIEKLANVYISLLYILIYENDIKLCVLRFYIIIH